MQNSFMPLDIAYWNAWGSGYAQNNRDFLTIDFLCNDKMHFEIWQNSTYILLYWDEKLDLSLF